MDHTVPTLRQRTVRGPSPEGGAHPEAGPAAGTRTPPVARPDGPVVLSLDDPDAARTELVGAKAANLATARHAGLPTLPGMVLTTAGASDLFSTGEPPAPVAAALRQAWETVSQHGQRAVVVRSSSTLEDADTSSMAGRFTSLLDVRGWTDLLAAVRTVLDSATSPELSDAPMAVLIQPFLQAARGGVLFGADPVTGNADHLVVAAVDGGPDQLVSGTVDGATTTLDRRGRPVAGSPLDRRTRRRMAALARRTETVFGGPQDMEWALDTDGTLWLLQSRPITTPVHHPTGARLGPGPVAETLPGVLTPLESDLWVDPLRRGLTEALTLSGAVAPGALRRSPVLVCVGGQVAVDLDLVEPARRQGLFGRIDPRPGARRLRAAWRVGRLRAALPALGRDLVGEVDGHLLDVPPLPELSDRQLLGVLRTTGDTLASLHGHEVLTGLLLDLEDAATTGAAVALEALAEGRAAGLDDGTILERDPVVLALVAPQVGPSPRLPVPPGRGTHPAGRARATDPHPALAGHAGSPSGVAGRSDGAGEVPSSPAPQAPAPGSTPPVSASGSDSLPRSGSASASASGSDSVLQTPAPAPPASGSTPPASGAASGATPASGPDAVDAPGAPEAAAIREALRIRARWVQELAAGAAWELGDRLHRAGRLPTHQLVRHLTLDELSAMVAGAPAPADLTTRPADGAVGAVAPAGDPSDRIATVDASRVGTSGVGPTPERPLRPGPAPVPGTTVAATPPRVPVPLPASFRLTAEGAVVPDVTAATGAQGAGGGTGQGPVHIGPDPAPGTVLVVRTLDPVLAPVLPGLAGLVAETGSPLSHLAILAREYGVPTVVGLAGALDTFAPGDVVEVDGTAGTVTPSTDQPSPDTWPGTEDSANTPTAPGDERSTDAAPGTGDRAGTTTVLVDEPDDPVDLGDPGQPGDELDEPVEVIILPAPQPVGWPAAPSMVDRLTAAPGTAAAALTGAIRAQTAIRARAHIPTQDLTGGER